jgi:hypothetical protein
VTVSGRAKGMHFRPALVNVKCEYEVWEITDSFSTATALKSMYGLSVVK